MSTTRINNSKDLACVTMDQAVKPAMNVLKASGLIDDYRVDNSEVRYNDYGNRIAEFEYVAETHLYSTDSGYTFRITTHTSTDSPCHVWVTPSLTQRLTNGEIRGIELPEFGPGREYPVEGFAFPDFGTDPESADEVLSNIAHIGLSWADDVAPTLGDIAN